MSSIISMYMYVCVYIYIYIHTHMYTREPQGTPGLDAELRALPELHRGPVRRRRDLAECVLKGLLVGVSKPVITGQYLTLEHYSF